MWGQADSPPPASPFEPGPAFVSFLTDPHCPPEDSVRSLYRSPFHGAHALLTGGRSYHPSASTAFHSCRKSPAVCFSAWISSSSDRWPPNGGFRLAFDAT